MNSQEKILMTSDGLALRAKCSTPEGLPKAVLVLTHGQGEHVGRYAHVGAWLAQKVRETLDDPSQ